MLKLKITNETSRLRTVVVGIAEDFGGTPDVEACYDPKSRNHVLAGTFPQQEGVVKEMNNLIKVFDRYNVNVIRPYNICGLNQIFSRDIAFVIEDKIGLKKNSLFTNQTGIKQDTIKNFSLKIKKAKESKISDDFFIVSRIESFILNKGLNDALKRAEAYSRAGADAILIHSKEKTPKEIFSFSKKFLKSKYYKPMIAVPSTYSKTYEKELIKNGFKIVIYANHLLRSAYLAMNNTAKSILKNQRTFEAEKKISSIKDAINLI